MDVLVLNDGALVYVTSEGAVYEWLAFSVSAVSSPTVIAPTLPPAGKTNGRWHKVITDWTYGAGGTNLGAKTSGYLKAVEAYSVDEGPDAAIEQVFGKPRRYSFSLPETRPSRTAGCVVRSTRTR